MKKTNKLLLIFAGFIIPLLLFNSIATVNAETQQILAGYYYYVYSYKRCDSVTVSWLVSSGPAIDIYLLTDSEYSDWVGTPSIPPSVATHSELSTTSGSFTETTIPSENYYLVFSNVNGGATVNLDFTADFNQAAVPGFELIPLICALIIAVYIYLQKRIKF